MQAMRQVLSEEDIAVIKECRRVHTSLFIVSGGGPDRAKKVHRVLGRGEPAA